MTEKLLEGILEKIESVEFLYERNREEKSHFHKCVLNEITSILLVNDGKQVRKIWFHGLVFPQSIGHKISIYPADTMKKDKGLSVRDEELDIEYVSKESPSFLTNLSRDYK